MLSFLSYSDTRLQSVVFLEESFSFQVFILKLSLLIVLKFALLLIHIQILDTSPASCFFHLPVLRLSFLDNLLRKRVCETGDFDSSGC
jgi:hypothetical protein